MSSPHFARSGLSWAGLLALLLLVVFAWSRTPESPVPALPPQASATQEIPALDHGPSSDAPSHNRSATPRKTTAPLTDRTDPGTGAQVPDKVFAVLDQIQAEQGRAPPGYVGGRMFQNREHRLPQGRYREYDVNPLRPGRDRGAERLVIEQQSGKAYYTGDHYRTFTLIN